MVKLKADFSQSDLDNLKLLSNRKGVTANSVLKQSIATEVYIASKLDSGAVFLVREANGDLKHIKFK